MTQYLSRRERRDAEKSGIPEELTTPKSEQIFVQQIIEESAVQLEAPFTPQALQVTTEESLEQISIQIPPAAEQDPSAQNQLVSAPSRRALREAEKSGKPIPVPVPENIEITLAPAKIEAIEESLNEPVASQAPDPVIEIIEEPITFTGTNLLAEPSTQSIVLEVVPEAVSLPIEVTGEIVSTGSIAVIPDTTAAIVTATMDGSQLDRVAMKDAVTGVISVVEPVSALAVISERENVGVVPEAALRKGWWIKWLIGIGALVMTAAAVWATLTILELIGN